MSVTSVRSTNPPSASTQSEQLSALAVANVMLRNRRLLVVVMVLVAGIAVVRALIAPRTYVSSATLIPAGRKATSQLSGLAAQFGIAVAGGDAQQSPDFLVALLRSRTVQGEVVAAHYSFQTEKGPFTGSLIDFAAREGVPPARRRTVAVQTLDGELTTGTSLKTGAVSLMVRTFSPTLSADIARNLLASLDRFNRAQWQVQAAREREFTEEQLAQAATELRAAEDRVVAFQEQNRDYNTSPRLRSQYERMTREAGMRQAVYTSLAQAYAQTRIESVRDSPSLTVIESPEVPPDPERRGLARIGVVALMAGLLLGMFLAFMREHFSRTRAQHPDEDAEYAMLRAEAARDLRNPLRLLRSRH